MSDATVTKTKIKVPPGLGPDGRRFYRAIAEQFSVDHAGEKELLFTAASALDRLKQAQRAIAKDGVVIPGRGGVLVRHPATTIEREARAGFLAALKLMDLQIDEGGF